ncbi:MAG TPA: LacI family DNA-binding transcriptional regulator [Candidatus Limnocylindria bacterium]|nr:LacI family DNA-binding transcriptional regulator [Candidatus Limnocylindria bacterium]
MGAQTTARHTINDVARLAGVHPSTVSRALHRADLPLSPETRRRVLAAVERLEYRPSAIARGLRLRRTRTLGMLVPDITNPFFPPIIRGAEEAARERGYELVLCNTDDDAEREKASLRVLRERQADGLLIATSRTADATLASVRRERFPFVLVNRGSRVAEDPAVEVNNARAAADIVAHLVQLGHKRIAHIAGPLSTTTGAERAAGYGDALRTHGLPRDARLIAEAVAYSEDAGYAATKRLLTVAPTAIFAANDLLALGALRAARDTGVRVPVDLSLVGVNDIPMVGLLDPPLTTARVPQREMGAIAARMLISLLEDEPVHERHVRLDAELVVRGSTGAPRTAGRRVA